MLLYCTVQVTQALLHYTCILRFFFFYMPNIINPDLEQVSDTFSVSEKHFGWGGVKQNWKGFVRIQCPNCSHTSTVIGSEWQECDFVPWLCCSSY